MSDYPMDLSTGLLSGIAIFVLITMFLLAGSIQIVPEGKRLRIFRLGRFLGERGPGLVFIIPFVDKGILIDPLDQMKDAQRRMVSSGVMGETLTPVHADGSVNINHETWNAVSKEFIPAGEKIRVIRVLVEIERLNRYSAE